MPENKSCENCGAEYADCAVIPGKRYCKDWQSCQPEPEKRMTDTELSACVALLSAKQFACESENRMREMHGQALAYTDGVDGRLESAIENELKARGVLK